MTPHNRVSTTFQRRIIALAVALVLVGIADAATNRTNAWSDSAAAKSHARAVHALGGALPSRLPPSSGGHVYWVDGAHGSDTSRGSRTRPWRTITRALASVPLSGSVIKVRPGTYKSIGMSYAITFNRHGDVRNPVTVTAAKRGTVTIENGDPSRSTIGAWVIRASGLRLVGLRFRVVTNRDSNLPANSVLIEDSHRIEVTRCIFNEVSVAGITVRGGADRPTDDVWAIANVFRPSGGNPTAQVTGVSYDNGQYFGTKGSHWLYAGQYQTDTAWDHPSGTRRLVVVNNIFTGTAAGRDIELGPQARNSFVVNNTFYGNRSAEVIGASTPAQYAGQAVELFSNTTSGEFTNGFNTVANNLFIDLHGHAVAGSGPSEPGNVVMHNLSWLVKGDDSTGSIAGPLAPDADGSTIFEVGRGNRTANPRLVDVGAYNFHPRRDSPALRAANPSLAYPYDASGRARPGAPAIGALELQCGRGSGGVC